MRVARKLITILCVFLYAPSAWSAPAFSSVACDGLDATIKEIGFLQSNIETAKLPVDIRLRDHDIVVVGPSLPSPQISDVTDYRLSCARHGLVITAILLKVTDGPVSHTVFGRPKVVVQLTPATSNDSFEVTADWILLDRSGGSVDKLVIPGLSERRFPVSGHTRLELKH